MFWLEFKKLKILFIWERGRVRDHEQGEGQGGSTLPGEQRAQCRTPPQDPRVMHQSPRQMPNRLSHPGAWIFKNLYAAKFTLVPHWILIFLLLKILFIYSERHTERGRAIGRAIDRWRSRLPSESPIWDSIPELQDQALSWKQSSTAEPSRHPRTLYLKTKQNLLFKFQLTQCTMSFRCTILLYMVQHFHMTPSAHHKCTP